jgi:hypothetical protein
MGSKGLARLAGSKGLVRLDNHLVAPPVRRWPASCPNQALLRLLSETPATSESISSSLVST